MTPDRIFEFVFEARSASDTRHRCMGTAVRRAIDRVRKSMEKSPEYAGSGGHPETQARPDNLEGSDLGSLQRFRRSEGEGGFPTKLSKSPVSVVRRSRVIQEFRWPRFREGGGGAGAGFGHGGWVFSLSARSGHRGSKRFRSIRGSIRMAGRASMKKPRSSRPESRKTSTRVLKKIEIYRADLNSVNRQGIREKNEPRTHLLLSRSYERVNR